MTLVRGVLDAPSEKEAQAMLALLAVRQHGERLARAIEKHLDAALIHQCPFNAGLMRVSPEWCWRGFRLRLSRGRNHGSPERLERATLVWAIYHNFTPAQWRCEHKRKYRRPGLSPLDVCGDRPGQVSYLDALGI